MRPFDYKLVGLKIESVEPDPQSNFRSFTVTVTNDNERDGSFSLLLDKQPEWVKYEGFEDTFIVNGKGPPGNEKLKLIFDRQKEVAGSFTAIVRLIDKDASDRMIRERNVAFGVDLTGVVNWTMALDPGAPDGGARVRVTITNGLNAPLYATLGAIPDSIELIFALDPGAEKIIPVPARGEATATVLVKQTPFKELASNFIVPFQFEYELKDPKAQDGVRREQLDSKKVSSPSPLPITWKAPWPTVTISKPELDPNPEKPQLKFNLTNNLAIRQTVNGTAKVGDESQPLSQIELEPNGSHPVSMPFSLLKLVGNYPVSVTATASAAPDRPVKKDISLDVPISGKLEWTFVHDKDTGDSTVCTCPLSLKNKLNAPVRVSLDNQKTVAPNLRTELAPPTLDIKPDGLDVAMILKVSQDRFQQKKSEIQVALAAQVILADVDAPPPGKLVDFDPNNMSSKSLGIIITWPVPKEVIGIENLKADLATSKVEVDLINKLDIDQTVDLDGSVGSTPLVGKKNVTLGRSGKETVSLDFTPPTLAGDYAVQVRAISELVKGQPVERASSVSVPLSPGFDFKVVPEGRSLKEGEDAHFQARITNKSNAKLSFSLVVNAPGKVAAFNGGQSDEYRKAGMVPQQTDQVDIVIRPGPDVKGPFAVKLVGPEYHDKDDRVLPPAQPDESRSLSIEWKPKSTAIPRGSVTLKPGEAIDFLDKRYKLILQTDGNLVEYDSSGMALWATGTSGKDSIAAVMQDDGNLVVYGPNKADGSLNPIWNSNTYGHPGATLWVRDNGNLEIHDAANNSVLWAAPPTILFLLNKATGFYLDSDKDKKVYTRDFNRGPYQQWKLIPRRDGYYFFQNRATGFYLDSDKDKKAYTRDFNRGPYQQWQLIPSGDGYYFFHNRATGFYLDSDKDKKVYTGDFNGGPFQQWQTIRGV